MKEYLITIFFKPHYSGTVVKSVSTSLPADNKARDEKLQSIIDKFTEEVEKKYNTGKIHYHIPPSSHSIVQIS